MVIARSLLYFLAAGLCEIGGGYLVWLWLRQGKSLWYALAGAVVLVLYGIIPTFQPANFGRVYAAYGGVFVVLSILWGWQIDKIVPSVDLRFASKLPTYRFLRFGKEAHTMKKDLLGPAALFVFVLAAFTVSFIFSSHAESAAASEEARTLQMIAPYRTWGKANVQPIIVSTDRMAPSG